MALRHDSFFDQGVGGTELEYLVADFRRSLLRRELSLNTVRSYDYGWKSFLRFLAKRGVTDSEQLTRDLVEAWQDSLHVKPRSKALASTAVRRLITFGAERDVLEYKLILAVARVKVRRLLPRPLPSDQLERIAAYLDRRRTRATLVGLRDRALFWYAIATGGRISELLQVTRGEAMHAVLVVQKGGSQRLLLCPDAVVAMIAEYLQARTDSARWLWVSHASNTVPQRLTPSAVREIWERLARRARVPRFNSHRLRHTSATQLYAADISDSVIAEHLGHQDTRHVMTYAQVDTAHRQQVVDIMDRLARRGQARPR